MDALRITAPRRTPVHRPVRPERDEHAANWNRFRTDGPPRWVDALERTEARLASIAAANPDAVFTREPDPSGSGTVTLPVLEIGRPGAPALMVVAGQHGREPAGSVAVVDWLEQLTEARRGGDAQARWLLDAHRLVVAPAANPRGLSGAAGDLRAAADGPEARDEDAGGFPGDTIDPSPMRSFFWRRKNQNGEHGGGVDLNRNHGRTWVGWPPGDPGATPEKHSWPGRSPASEPETRIVDELLARVRPTLVIDVHQFGNFALGVVPTGIPKAGASRALTRLVAGTPLAQPPAEHIRKSDEVAGHGLGGMLDAEAAARGAHVGVTLEFGTSFLPTDEQYGSIRASVATSLTNALRAAADPVSVLQGPDVSSTPRRSDRGLLLGVSDARTGSADIAAAELVFDPVAAPGTGTPLVAADGAFDEPFEHVRLGADVAGAGPVGVRARDADGHWGPVTAVDAARR